MARFTEGIVGDGVVILCDGVKMPISDVIEFMNRNDFDESSPEILNTALRQYRHNNSDEIIHAFDHERIIKIFHTMQAEIATLGNNIDLLNIALLDKKAEIDEAFSIIYRYASLDTHNDDLNITANKFLDKHMK